MKDQTKFLSKLFINEFIVCTRVNEGREFMCTKGELDFDLGERMGER